MLQALAANAGGLEDHGGGLDPSFDYLRRSLARDANEAYERYRSGNYVGARYALSKITENCVTCHTKRPASDRSFDLGEDFMESPHIKNLPPTARVQLEIATRQFDDAADTYEMILSSPDMTAADLETFSVFENYLKVCIGAMNDTERPAMTLRKFTERSDMPEDLLANVDKWAEALSGLDLDRYKGEELVTAGKIIEAAAQMSSSTSDRVYLVAFIEGRSLLHRYLQTQPTNDVEIAEAYYLLGVAESYVARSYWISETDFLLEKAIRQAPKSDVAKKALAYLEAYTQSGAKVEPARDVPPELETNLEELRKLVEG